MDWLEITVLTTTAGSDLVSELLMEAGSSGTMIEDKNDVALNQRPEGQWDIIDEEIARRIGDDVKVTGYYEVNETIADTTAWIRSELERLRAADLGFDAGKLEMITGKVDEEDWAESWKKNFHPFRIGRHFVVKPGWEQFDTREGDVVLEIDPGMAFGTGTHETTGMCTELVEDNIVPGMKVLDIGTGTGILAIAAAKCGAVNCLATDIDKVAVRVAKENIEKNGCAGLIDVRAGNLLEVVDGTYDVVIANIIADVIIGMAKDVIGVVRPGGLFIASGITREKRDSVIGALKDAGFDVKRVMEKGEWCAILSGRNA